MSQPLSHARIGWDSVTRRSDALFVGSLTELAGYASANAINALTYSFWSSALPAVWGVSLAEAETVDYFGIAAHDLHTNHVVAVLQAFIDDAYRTLPVLTRIGDLWSFNGDLYGARGATPKATVGSLRRGLSVDGEPIKPFFDDAGGDFAGAQESKFGARALTVEPAITNLFPANVRTGTDTSLDMTGFDAGSDGASSSFRSVSGTRSVLLSNGGAAAVLTTDPVSCDAATDYTVQCKVNCPEGVPTVTMHLYGDVSGLLDTVEFDDVPPGAWHLLKLTATTGGSDAAIHAVLEVDESYCYADEFQLEEGDTAHTWVDGSQAAGDLEYQPEIAQQFAHDVTLNVWVRMTDPTTAANRTIVAIGQSGGNANRMRLLRLAGTDDISFSTSGPAEVFDNLIETVTWDGGWKMVTCVIDGGTKLLYVDGQLVDQSSTSNTPDWSAVDLFHVGHASGTARVGDDGESLIDDLLLTNYAATPEQIAAWYAAGEAMTLTDALLETHADNRPIMRLVEAATSRRFLVRLAGDGTPTIGHISIGKALEMPQGLYAGHQPVSMSRTTVIRPNVSERGQFLGRSIIRSGAVGSWAWDNLPAAWVREYLDPFIESARSLPFFIAWKPDRYPGEVGYCWTSGDPAPVNNGRAGLMSFQLDAEGLANE